MSTTEATNVASSAILREGDENGNGADWVDHGKEKYKRRNKINHIVLLDGCLGLSDTQ